MRIEVLTSIKKSEEEYRSMISQALAEKKKSIQNAELEADNLVMKAQESAEEYRKQKIAEMQRSASEQHALVVNTGEQKAAAMVEKGNANLPKAVELLITRFKERMHA